MIFLNKKKNKIYIEKSIKKDINLERIYKDYPKINNKELKNEINSYIDEVSKFVKSEIEKKSKRYKAIYFNMQNNNIIIRKVKVLNIKNKKDIESMIAFEINQYMPIDINDYSIKYKIIETTEKELDLQVILMPKYMIDICKQIAYMLNMKPKNMNINFDILQKMIAQNLIDNFTENGLFIESKENEFILSKVKNKTILETYILPKTNQSYKSIEILSEQYRPIYYYGIEVDDVIKGIENTDCLIKLQIDKSICVEAKNDLLDDNTEYINSIGMVI